MGIYDYNETRNKLEGLEFEDNLKLARKYMVESVYRSANIEGIGVTFPETQAICDGMSVSGHTIDEINAINDLKKAWQWFFNNPTASVDVDTLKTINRILGKFTVINAGTMRTISDEPVRVKIHEGYYYPKLPSNEEEINKDIKDILRIKDKLDSSLELFCYVVKGQFFNDGNKRTATIFANIHLIQNNQGILSIPDECKLDFYNALANYYADDKNKEELKQFFKEKCITGIKTRDRNRISGKPLKT